ncbi:MAG: hypothetical protein M5R36_13845 [Deltaproteobacteria bacterium]|nr:hypothetical protein [Deltaproteobacteria bacterium]
MDVKRSQFAFVDTALKHRFDDLALFFHRVRDGFFTLGPHFGENVLIDGVQHDALGQVSDAGDDKALEIVGDPVVFMHNFLEAVEKERRFPPHDLGKNFLFALEIEIDGALAHAGAGGDLVDGRFVKTAPREMADGGFDDGFFS